MPTSSGIKMTPSHRLKCVKSSTKLARFGHSMNRSSTILIILRVSCSLVTKHELSGICFHILHSVTLKLQTGYRSSKMDNF